MLTHYFLQVLKFNIGNHRDKMKVLKTSISKSLPLDYKPKATSPLQCIRIWWKWNAAMNSRSSFPLLQQYCEYFCLFSYMANNRGTLRFYQFQAVLFGFSTPRNTVKLFIIGSGNHFTKSDGLSQLMKASNNLTHPTLIVRRRTYLSLENVRNVKGT